MILPLVYYGDPILRKKAQPITEITDEIRQLVSDMIDTMRAKDGIGLAAPQIGKSIALCVTEVPIEVPQGNGKSNWLPGKVRVFINPKIVGHSEEQWLRGEGCLSIPGIFGEVSRPILVVVEAMDLEGKIFQEELTWLEGRAIMHENDHLNGVLFFDRIHGRERKEIDVELQKFKKLFPSKK
jgi:peptide deformylase